MKIYKISQDINCGYDTYDSAVVIAESPKDARMIHPDNEPGLSRELDWLNPFWVKKTELDFIKVEYIGEAAPDQKRSVVLASFNPG